jgi:hypothetical protein
MRQSRSTRKTEDYGLAESHGQAKDQFEQGSKKSFGISCDFNFGCDALLRTDFRVSGHIIGSYEFFEWLDTDASATLWKTEDLHQADFGGS